MSAPKFTANVLPSSGWMLQDAEQIADTQFHIEAGGMISQTINLNTRKNLTVDTYRVELQFYGTQETEPYPDIFIRCEFTYSDSYRYCVTVPVIVTGGGGTVAEFSLNTRGDSDAKVTWIAYRIFSSIAADVYYPTLLLSNNDAFRINNTYQNMQITDGVTLQALDANQEMQDKLYYDDTTKDVVFAGKVKDLKRLEACSINKTNGELTIKMEGEAPTIVTFVEDVSSITYTWPDGFSTTVDIS